MTSRWTPAERCEPAQHVLQHHLQVPRRQRNGLAKKATAVLARVERLVDYTEVKVQLARPRPAARTGATLPAVPSGLTPIPKIGSTTQPPLPPVGCSCGS